MMQEGRAESMEGEPEAKRRRIVLRSEVFRLLSEEGLTDVSRRSTLAQVDRRRYLFRSSDEPHVYLLGSGRVRRVRGADGDVTLTLDYRGPGELVGEDALVGPHVTEALAMEHVEALRLPLSLVRRLLSREARFASALLDIALSQSIASEHRLESLVHRSVESRVAEFLIDAGRRYGVADSRGTLIGVKLTHQEIASYVGSTRETVTLILGDLKRAGCVATDHRRVIITSEALLRQRI